MISLELKISQILKYFLIIKFLESIRTVTLAIFHWNSIGMGDLARDLIYMDQQLRGSTKRQLQFIILLGTLV